MNESDQKQARIKIIFLNYLQFRNFFQYGCKALPVVSAKIFYVYVIIGKENGECWKCKEKISSAFNLPAYLFHICGISLHVFQRIHHNCIVNALLRYFLKKMILMDSPIPGFQIFICNVNSIHLMLRISFQQSLLPFPSSGCTIFPLRYSNARERPDS